MHRFLLPAVTAAASPPAFGRREGRAFTLIEMLVVIAIIGVLASILVPVIGGVRESATMAVCTSRLRELGAAFQLYAQENSGELPHPKSAPGSRWPFHVASYLGSSYQTRYDSTGQVSGITGSANLYDNPLIRDPANAFNPTSEAEGTFAFNVKIDADHHKSGPVRIADLSAPDTFPVLATSEGNGQRGGLLLESAGPSPKARTLGYSGVTHRNGPAPNYGRQAVFLFADWHVSAVDVCDPRGWPWNDPQAFTVR